MKCIVKKDLIATFDTYSAYDENENLIYKIKTEFLSNVKTFKIYKNDDNEIAILKRKFTSILPYFYLLTDNQENGFIKKLFTFIRPKYNISDKYEATGNAFNTKYSIKDTNKNIGEIKRIQPAAESTFEINIENNGDILLFVLFVVVVEELKVRNNRKRRARRR